MAFWFNAIDQGPGGSSPGPAGATGSAAALSEETVPKNELTVLQDNVADALDDLAVLGAHWTRNRDRGRMPNGIRQAMLIVAREAIAYAEASDLEIVLTPNSM